MTILRRLAVAFVLPLWVSVTTKADDSGRASENVSYYRDVRPIFQAHCQGCHQPARAGGEYVMTEFARLVSGGESGEAAVVPGHTDQSPLLSLITPADGQAEMPKEAAPLNAAQIETIRRWIAAGAADDTPANARPRFDIDHPPVYSRAPNITSLDYSPDGTLLAVAGFHEVLLHKSDGSGLVARLVGLSDRVESVAFSPDGRRLAVTGGQPERMGELQIWAHEESEDGERPQSGEAATPGGRWMLEHSIPMTFDTLYGASWSPDGHSVAVGCGDASVRAFDVRTGKQVFYNGAHEDWALATVFSVDGSHLVSVGRDMSTKLYEFATQRFVDNVTSITPGALKGGLTALDRHPTRDEVLVGGSDGVPRIYHMHRLTKRVIGDDANLLRRFPAMTGRLHSVAYAPDGKTIAAASSLDGQGQVFTYTAEFDSALPDDIKGIVEKVVTTQTPEEKQKLETYLTAGVSIRWKQAIGTAVYALAYSPDGQTLAVAGADGLVRLLDVATGQARREFLPIDVEDAGPAAPSPGDAEETVVAEAATPGLTETLPEGAALTGLTVTPPVVSLTGPYDYRQLLVTGTLSTGETADVTRMCRFTLGSEVASITPVGRVRARTDGLAALVVSLGDQLLGVPVSVSGVEATQGASYIRDVMPVISKLGCNAGTCHGSKDGKDGFKLSLRGYDPIFDVRAWTDDLKSRRVNLASPDDSLMLLKATGAVPHVGGQLTTPADPYYQVIRRWIAEGARLELQDPRVVGIEIEPRNPVLQQIGARQQMQVLASYSDGTRRDVTAEAFLESGNTDILAVNADGVVTTLRRGEAPVLARFEGAYAATTLTAMGDRTGFVWEQPESWNRVDELVAQKWERMKIRPSGLCTDAEFIRRVSLDLTGLPPTADDVRQFLADDRPSRQKRDELVDRLIGSEAFVEYWTNKWADLLQVNSKFLGADGARAFRDWIREQVAANTPYDEFCSRILTAEGSNKEHPAASYFKILREPELMMENTTHLFLAVRFNCNKCHDHPFERWTQDQYYQTAAFFARTGLKKDEASGTQTIGGTAVEGAKPLYEVVFEKPEGEVTHERTGAVTAPAFPFEVEFPSAADAPRRQQLAGWITSADNPYFVQSYVNRVWGYLMGVGLIEPLDDIRAGNPPTNPELLDWLSGEFVRSDFNVRALMRIICTSRSYQLSIEANPWNEDDTTNYSHAVARRLPAEVLYDTVHRVTGSKMQIPGVPEGTRAAALPDAGIELADGFLANLGRPPRESACECERSDDLQLGPVLALMNGLTVSQAISQPDNEIARLVSSESDDERVINELFLRILNRPARPQEVAAARDLRASLQAEHASLVQELAAYREKIAPDLAHREAQRQALIDAAQAELDAYRKEIAPREAELDRQQQEQTVRLARELEAYDQKPLADALAKFEDEYERTVTWVPLTELTAKSSNSVTLQVQPDGSILATGTPTDRSDFTIVGETALRQITGIRLEVLAHESLPGFGPGLAENGNFVLTELTARWAPPRKPRQATALAFAEALADVSQAEYDVQEAINGKLDQAGDGWAILPGTGKDHVAIFSLKEPLKRTEATRLTLVLDQRYIDRKHAIGRFRISVTDAAEPLSFGVPREIDHLLSLARGARTPEQQEQLLAWFRTAHAERRERELAVAKSRLPRPVDPGILERDAKLADVSQPLPPDLELTRLERAVELGEQQLKNERLTAAQDLAWALINSPAFLFNR